MSIVKVTISIATHSCGNVPQVESWIAACSRVQLRWLAHLWAYLVAPRCHNRIAESVNYSRGCSRSRQKVELIKWPIAVHQSVPLRVRCHSTNRHAHGFWDDSFSTENSWWIRYPTDLTGDIWVLVSPSHRSFGFPQLHLRYTQVDLEHLNKYFMTSRLRSPPSLSLSHLIEYNYYKNDPNYHQVSNQYRDGFPRSNNGKSLLTNDSQFIFRTDFLYSEFALNSRRRKVSVWIVNFETALVNKEVDWDVISFPFHAKGTRV